MCSFLFFPAGRISGIEMLGGRIFYEDPIRVPVLWLMRKVFVSRGRPLPHKSEHEERNNLSLLGFMEISQTILQENTLSAQFSSGTTFSFPVLVRRQNRVLDAMFLYLPSQNNGQESPRPYAWLMLDSLSGQVALLSDCGVLDFMDTQKYPLRGVVSMALPRPLTPQAYTNAYKNLYEVYEQLRIFAFEPEPADWQLEAMAQYRALFLRLVPIGHYPFYTALAPDFLAWIGLRLADEVEEEAAAPEKEPANASPEEPEPAVMPMEEPPETAAGNTLAQQSRDLEPLLEELRLLREEFAQRSAASNHKDHLLDNMHAELTSYKNGLLDALTASLENDVIKLIDDVEKSVGAYKKKTATKENYKSLLLLLEGLETDLCDLLYRHGLEPFSVVGDAVDIHRQKILAVKNSDERDKDKKTALRHARGWEKDGKIVRPERISVYVYTPHQESGDGETDIEDES